MDLKERYRLNNLINKIAFVQDYINSNGKDPLLEESLYDYKKDLRISFGEYLMSQLFKVYDEYFEDNNLDSLENYICGEATVHGEEFDQSELNVKIKPFPLRIELSNPSEDYRNIIWQAA